MTKEPTYEVPFDSRGWLMHYARKNGGYFSADKWVKPHEFSAKLKLERMSVGRSSKLAIWKSSDDIEYPMFISDLLYLIKNTTIKKGVVSGVFTQCKRGQNYGIKYLKPNA